MEDAEIIPAECTLSPDEHTKTNKREKKLLLDTFVQNSAAWDSSGAGLCAWSAERSLLVTSDITSFLEING